MSDPNFRRLADIVGTWQIRRIELTRDWKDGANASSFERFAGVLNANTRQIISLLQEQDPEWWSALAELSTNVVTHLSDARIMANHKDVTNL